MYNCHAMTLLTLRLPLTLLFCFKNRFIKFSLILSSEMLTLLFFASRIHAQCCMMHVMKRDVFIRGWGEGGGWGSWPPLSERPCNIPPHLSNPKTLSSFFFYEAWGCSWNWGGGGACKKKVALQSREDGPKNRLRISSHPQIITINCAIPVWIKTQGIPLPQNFISDWLTH